MSKPQFLDQPGFRERQLQRRYHNPLFTAGQQKVTQAQVDAARQQDKLELQQFAEALQALLIDVSQFSAREETDKILQTKEQADKLYEQCIGLAGEHERERQGLLKLNDVIMAAIRSAAGQDPLALDELEKEQQARDIHLALLEYRLVADILRPDNDLQEEELLPTILSEDKESIQMAMTLFSNEQRELLEQQAEQLKQKLQHDGDFNEQLQKKFQAMFSTAQ
jgi:hypothetical protein